MMCSWQGGIKFLLNDTEWFHHKRENNSYQKKVEDCLPGKKHIHSRRIEEVCPFLNKISSHDSKLCGTLW